MLVLLPHTDSKQKVARTDFEVHDNSFIELLKYFRQDEGPREKKNRTQIHVPPGKSAGVSYFILLEDQDQITVTLDPNMSLPSTSKYDLQRKLIVGSLSDCSDNFCMICKSAMRN